MKKYFAALVLHTVLASAAQAETVTYEYRAKVNQIGLYDWNKPSPSYLDALALPEDSISLGDTILGTFSYDTSTPLQPLAGSEGYSGSRI